MLKSTFKTTVLEEKDLTSNEGVEQGQYFKVALEPLNQGYGHTLGNSLRRVLLNSIEGSAISKVKIKGVNHQFTTMEGMSEDIVEFILNLKQVRLSLKTDEDVTLKLSAKGKGEIKAKDIIVPAGVKIANPNLVLASLASSKSKLEAELFVKSGVGYVMAEHDSDSSLGEIAIDSLFSPVTKVAYKVEATRVGRQTDFDKLILEIWTDGTVQASDLLEKAAKVLVNHFKQIYDPVASPVEDSDEMVENNNENLNLTVEELGIPTRIANALRNGGYKTAQDLSQATSSEVAKVKNLGEKSVKTVAKALKKIDLDFKE